MTVIDALKAKLGGLPGIATAMDHGAELPAKSPALVIEWEAEQEAEPREQDGSLGLEIVAGVHLMVKYTSNPAAARNQAAGLARSARKELFKDYTLGGTCLELELGRTEFGYILAGGEKWALAKFPVTANFKEAI